MAAKDDIVILIPGQPVPWKAHGGYGRRSFNPLWREREYFQAKIKEQYHGPLIESAVEVEYDFYFEPPTSTSKKKKLEMLEGFIRPAKRPDSDNLAKFLSDCLQGIVFKDDGQIVYGHISKYYGLMAKTIVKIYPC